MSRFSLNSQLAYILTLLFISLIVSSPAFATGNRQCFDACQAAFNNCAERAGADNEFLFNCEAECEANYDPQDDEIGNCYQECRENYFDPFYQDCLEDLDVCERICEATPTPTPSRTASPKPSLTVAQPTSFAAPSPSPTARR